MRNTLLMVLAMTGCGGADWNGHFSGPTTVAGSCSDGSGGTQTIAESLTLTQTDDSISFPIGCGLVGHATIHGGTASLTPISCPETTSNGNILNKSFTDGTLKLDGDKLTLNITSVTNIRSSTGQGSCSSVETGSLTLVP